VACLWGCLLAEHKILEDARRLQAKELIELRHLRDSRITVPASLPVPRTPIPHPVSS